MHLLFIWILGHVFFTSTQALKFILNIITHGTHWSFPSPHSYWLSYPCASRSSRRGWDPPTSRPSVMSMEEEAARRPRWVSPIALVKGEEPQEQRPHIGDPTRSRLSWQPDRTSGGEATRSRSHQRRHLIRTSPSPEKRGRPPRTSPSLERRGRIARSSGKGVPHGQWETTPTKPDGIGDLTTP